MRGGIQMAKALIVGERRDGGGDGYLVGQADS